MDQSLNDSLAFRSGNHMQNRFALAPLTNHQCEADGQANDAEVKWLGMRAEGGFGMVMTCAAQIDSSGMGQGFPGQLGVHHDKMLPGMRRIAETLKDTFSVVQIHHAGVRAPEEVTGHQPVGPSDHEETGSRAMTPDEIQRVIQDFISAAVRCEEAGFGGVEIHGAHGYLLTQFLSAEQNLRTDEYGGSYTNRTRIVREIIAGIERECSDKFSIGIRLSPEGYGMPLTEVRRLCQELINTGSLDYLDISLWDSFKEPEEEEFQGRSLLSYFTDLNWGDVKLVVAGKLKTPSDMESVMRQGVDFVMLGRAGILAHDFPERYKNDPAFEPTRLPVTAEHLKREGLSPAFVKYLSGWDDFVLGD